MNWIEINGGATRYRFEGDGPATLVLIHEMGGTLESWEPLMPHVATGRRVLRYDMRGCGGAAKLRGTASMDEMVDDLVALLDALGIEGPVDLGGMAVGGAIALHVAARHPGRVRRLALMGPALGVAPERRAIVRERADRFEAVGMAGLSESELAMSYAEPLRGNGRFPSYRARWLGNDPSSYAATYRMLAELDAGPALATIRCTTLMLAGELDPLRPPDLIRRAAAQVDGARFDTVSGGHVMAHQTPDEVAGKLHAFLHVS